MRPSLTSMSVMYAVICDRKVDYNCKTKYETSGKYTPCEISITRAGRCIIVTGCPVLFFVDYISSGVV